MSALLAVLGVGRTIAAWVLGMARRHPWPIACAVALLLAWCQWNGKEKVLAARDKARSALAIEKTSRAAERANWGRQVAAAQVALEAAERKSQEIATDAQKSHDALAADTGGLHNYIASRRLRARANSPAAAGATDDLGAAVHGQTAGPAVVAADEADLVACDDAYVYSASAHEWVRWLIAEGLATSPSE